MPDVIVVGAGSAGCALAGRLAERGVDVLLLEAGPLTSLPELRDAASLAATAPGHPRNWAHPALLRADQQVLVPRGRGLGGSSAINGANWVRATPTDADAWGPGWTWADLLPHYVASETDLDFPRVGTSEHASRELRTRESALPNRRVAEFGAASPRVSSRESPNSRA